MFAHRFFFFKNRFNCYLPRAGCKLTTSLALFAFVFVIYTNSEVSFAVFLKFRANMLFEKVKKCAIRHVSILQWLPRYTKADLLCDFIAGITVGLTMMPQSIAYAALADIPAQYGLYTAFIGSFTYIFFGTIKEVSIGPTSLMALLIFTYTEGLPIDYVVLLCFLAGCVEFLMGVLKLGFLVDFMSAPVVSGFTSATSIIIIGTQTKGLLGIKFKNHGLFDLVIKLFQHLNEIKVADATLGFCCIIFLFAFKKLSTIPIKNYAIKKALWFTSISRNALIVLITSSIGYYYHEHSGGAPFKITGNVPSGLPSVKPPPFSTVVDDEPHGFFEMIQTLGMGILIVPLIAVLANVAIAKSFAVGTVVDATQELMTLGLCNIFGSFVQSMPTCGAFTRSAVSHTSGVKTPLQGLFSGSIILLALSFLTPYFYYIPRATLSAILISAVVTLIDYESLPKLWKCNKFDFSLTAITFFVSIIYGVEFGLMVGVIVNMFSLLKIWTRPRIETKICMGEKGHEYVLIKPELGLQFPAVDYITQEVIKISVQPEMSHLPVVLDFGNILKIDYTACQGVELLIKAFNKKERQLVLQNVNPRVFRILKCVLDFDKLHFCQSTEDICARTFDYGSNVTEMPLLNTEKELNEQNKYLSNLPTYESV